MATNQGFKSFIPAPDLLESKYLYHWLRTNRSYLESLGNGATFKELSKATVSRIEIPLPPLPEQRRIAAILDKADDLRARRRAAIAKLDTLAQATFLDMFGDSSRWPTCRVADYVAEFQGGRSFESDSDDGANSRNRVLRVSAVTGMRFLPHESKPVPDGYVPPLEHFVRDGDLLFSRANTTQLVGAVAYVHTPPPNLLLPDKLWRFVWRQPPRVEPLFVWALFQTPAIREEIGRRATGTSGSMKNISQAKVLDIMTIAPPIEAQRAFVSRLKSSERMRSSEGLFRTKVEALCLSLQDRAFRGEL